MLHLVFSDSDLKALHYQRFHHPHPRVQVKMEALLLKAKGLPHQQIAELAGISENTLRSYFKQYQHGGVEALAQLNFYRPSSQLQLHRQSLEDFFRANPPATIPQAVKQIEELTGLKRSPTQVGVFLRNIGLKRLKTYSVPAKFDQEQQAAFKKKS
jgi:transposase